MKIQLLTIGLVSVLFTFGQTNQTQLHGEWLAEKKWLVSQDGDSSDYSKYNTGGSALFNLRFDENGLVELIYEEGKELDEFEMRESVLIIGNVLYNLEKLDEDELIISKKFMFHDRFVFIFRRKNRSKI